jgi:Holliday junction resolvase RusA-like endonuclease
MNACLVLEIPEVPTVKKRPQVTWVHGRVHTYTPAQTVAAERRIREHAQAQLGDDWVALEGPVSLSITVYRKLPQRIPRRLRTSALPTARPDVDNHLKLALDALTAGPKWCGIWADDAQVVEAHAYKRYAVDRAPGWVITVESLSPGTGAAVANPELVCPPGGVGRVAGSPEGHA